MTERANPFTKEFVLQRTADNMQRAIDISINKTFERVKDFEDNSEKSLEVFETLSTLHQMRKNIDDFRNTNSQRSTENVSNEESCQ